MNVRYAGFRAVRDAASDVGLEARVLSAVDEDGGIELVLRPHGEGYRAKGPKRTVCLHGYEAFIEALLERKPNAVVETRETTYQGLADFDARQDEIMQRLEDEYGDQGCGCE